jgi:hypothetical protein
VHKADYRVLALLPRVMVVAGRDGNVSLQLFFFIVRTEVERFLCFLRSFCLLLYLGSSGTELDERGDL